VVAVVLTVELEQQQVVQAADQVKVHYLAQEMKAVILQRKEHLVVMTQTRRARMARVVAVAHQAQAVMVQVVAAVLVVLVLHHLLQEHQYLAAAVVAVVLIKHQAAQQQAVVVQVVEMTALLLQLVQEQ
jgi:hypothetical protein